VSDERDDSSQHRPPEQENPVVKDLPGVAAFAAMGMTAALIVAAGVVIGLWVDHAWGTDPWGLLIGIALGTVAAVVSVVKQVRRFL
jgi:F0F1-type ATP synthase assembly protein I